MKKQIQKVFFLSFVLFFILVKGYCQNNYLNDTNYSWRYCTNNINANFFNIKQKAELFYNNNRCCRGY